MANCPYCSKPIPETISRSTECPSCGRSLHCCKCCSFYSPDSHYGCKETIDEPVWDKSVANFCDYYKFNTSLGSFNGSDNSSDKAKKSREALDKLFSI